MKQLTEPITKPEMDAILIAKRKQLKLIRGFDFVASGVGLVLLAPIFLIVGLLIKLDSKGPALYRQIRVGKNGKPFRIIKFRSMVLSADQRGSLLTVKGDERITRVGERLRRLKLDELPQLINVFKGDMSLVGPRPEVPKYVEYYDENARQVLRVRPGVTDLASIAYIDESSILSQVEDVDQVYLNEIVPTKHSLNYQYIRNMSLLYNIKVIFNTVIKIFKR